ncbi:MAG: DUF2306 domain-containing protein [Vicinamibacterales bacterium]
MYWLVLVSGFLVALYALAYIVVGPGMYPDQLFDSFVARPWGIYPHALFGSVAMLTGALQFRRSLLVNRPAWHRRAGVTYVVAATVTGAVGVYMAIYSFGGWLTHVGFGLLGLALIGTTLQAFLSIKRWDIAAHRAWMLRSYALLFAAVMLRIELPLLAMALGDFTPAYQAVAWISWVPNLAWAEWWIARTREAEAPFIASYS